MDLITIFGLGGIVIFLGFFGEYIFEKTNIPDALWLILFGLIVGHFINVKDSPAFQQIGIIFTTFALIFILFEGVLKINLKELFLGLTEGTEILVIHFALTMAITALAMLLLRWGILEGLLLGVILGDSSQAVILPLTKKVSIKSQALLIVTIEAAISDVFCIVGAVALMNIILLQSVTVPAVVQQISYSLIMGILVGIGAGLIWIKVLPLLNRFSKSYMTTIAAILVLYAGIEYFGGSGALACLAFGIVVGNTKQIFHAINKEIKYDMGNSARFFYSQITFFLKTFFFVYVGMIINLNQMPLVILGGMLAVLIFLVRPISVAIGFKDKGDIKDRAFLEVLNPKGLSAVVLAQLPMQYGLPHGEEFATIVLSAVVVSILISVIGVFLVEKGYFKGINSFIKKKDAESD